MPAADATDEMTSEASGNAGEEAEILFDILPVRISFRDEQGQPVESLKKFILKIESGHVERESEPIIIQSYEDMTSEKGKWVTTVLDKKENEILEESTEEKDTVSFRTDREAYYAVFYFQEEQEKSSGKASASAT